MLSVAVVAQPPLGLMCYAYWDAFIYLYYCRPPANSYQFDQFTFKLSKQQGFLAEKLLLVGFLFCLINHTYIYNFTTVARIVKAVVSN